MFLMIVNFLIKILIIAQQVQQDLCLNIHNMKLKNEFYYRKIYFLFNIK